MDDLSEKSLIKTAERFEEGSSENRQEVRKAEQSKPQTRSIRSIRTGGSRVQWLRAGCWGQTEGVWMKGGQSSGWLSRPEHFLGRGTSRAKTPTAGHPTSPCYHSLVCRFRASHVTSLYLNFPIC